MFYEEEEQEVAKIQYKYKLMKQKVRERMFDLRVNQFWIWKAQGHPKTTNIILPNNATKINHKIFSS